MTWVKLDDQFFSNPKVIDLSKDQKLLYLIGLTYCASQLTDGRITKGALRIIAATVEVATHEVNHLVNCGLWEQDADGWVIHDYLEYNPRAEDVKDRRNHLSEIRSRAGKKGADARWIDGKPDGKTPKEDGKPDGKSRCENGKPDGKSDSNRGGKPIAPSVSRPDSDPQIQKALLSPITVPLSLTSPERATSKPEASSPINPDIETSSSKPEHQSRSPASSSMEDLQRAVERKRALRAMGSDGSFASGVTEAMLPVREKRVKR